MLQGVSSPSQCERIALVLHYTHICCAMWIVALAAAVAEYCACDTFLPLKYNYLLAYGVPAVIVMVSAIHFDHFYLFNKFSNIHQVHKDPISHKFGTSDVRMYVCYTTLERSQQG